jgi:hypothetical protein
MDCELSGVILIFDEAHNWSSRRVLPSQTLTEFTVDKALVEAMNLGGNGWTISSTFSRC